VTLGNHTGKRSGNRKKIETKKKRKTKISTKAVPPPRKTSRKRSGVGLGKKDGNGGSLNAKESKT